MSVFFGLNFCFNKLVRFRQIKEFKYKRVFDDVYWFGNFLPFVRRSKHTFFISTFE